MPFVESRILGPVGKPVFTKFAGSFYFLLTQIFLLIAEQPTFSRKCLKTALFEHAWLSLLPTRKFSRKIMFCIVNSSI